jgi:hypothetical protein
MTPAFKTLRLQFAIVSSGVLTMAVLANMANAAVPPASASVQIAYFT